MFFLGGIFYISVCINNRKRSIFLSIKGQITLVNSNNKWLVVNEWSEPIKIPNTIFPL
jgi:hypothetical protein